MSDGRYKTVGIGEILWDLLPTGKMLGGAPANFAYVSNALGNDAAVLSRVGNDQLGGELLGELKNKNLSPGSVQTDEKNPTGIVKVELENGQPSYEIVEGAAWDFLELDVNWREIASRTDAVCFGSLSQRTETSRDTIREFVELTKGLRIFDVNLRQRYFSPKVLQNSFALANVVKLNHEELPTVAEMLEIESENPFGAAKVLREKFRLKLICVTRGAGGSVLITENETSEFAGLKIEIADAIGAGDAFAAGMTHGILRGWSLNEINEFANRVGAFVASNTGAMPDFRHFSLFGKSLN